jgi:hypothetical protein
MQGFAPNLMQPGGLSDVLLVFEDGDGCGRSGARGAHQHFATIYECHSADLRANNLKNRGKQNKKVCLWRSLPNFGAKTPNFSKAQLTFVNWP